MHLATLESLQGLCAGLRPGITFVGCYLRQAEAVSSHVSPILAQDLCQVVARKGLTPEAAEDSRPRKWHRLPQEHPKNCVDAMERIVNRMAYASRVTGVSRTSVGQKSPDLPILVRNSAYC